MEHIDIAKELGKQVSRGKPLTCPLCGYDDGPGFKLDRWEDNDACQRMASWGNFEDTLFCPHCDLTVELKVTHPGYRYNWVKTHIEGE